MAAEGYTGQFELSGRLFQWDDHFIEHDVYLVTLDERWVKNKRNG